MMMMMIETALKTLRCPRCHGQLELCDHTGETNGDRSYWCGACNERFPTIRGVPRLLLSPLREALLTDRVKASRSDPQFRTALSFGYEWTHFPEMYKEWEKTFFAYMQPHSADFFRGKKVLDAGCGNGRFAFYAARFGAEVWAVDLGPAVEIASENTRGAGEVQVIQADLHQPPFAPETFDFIYSIGVLHHLPDPEMAFRKLLSYLKPGGEIQIYLYWQPEGQPIKRGLLSIISGLRQITTRLPLPLTYALAFPAAVAAYGLFVWPYRLLRKVPTLANWAEKIPMKQYSQFPFRVCINDQLDRFSAPIENRYTRRQVEDWLTYAGLENTGVYTNYGWVGTGRKPLLPEGAV
jgi:SAM-dependent methyltransferase/uncharacterized protein YbaR (Trm112 family)